MARRWLAWVVLSTVGVVVIALPDTDRRLFSLSEGHGPSLVDGVGVMLLVAGWIVLDVATWRRRRLLSPPPVLIGLAAAAAVGATTILVWSVLGDHGTWWVIGAAVLAAIQLAAAARVTIAERSTGAPS